METALTLAGTFALFSGWAGFVYQWKTAQSKALRRE